MTYKGFETEKKMLLIEKDLMMDILWVICCTREGKGLSQTGKPEDEYKEMLLVSGLDPDTEKSWEELFEEVYTRVDLLAN